MDENDAERGDDGEKQRKTLMNHFALRTIILVTSTTITALVAILKLN